MGLQWEAGPTIGYADTADPLPPVAPAAACEIVQNDGSVAARRCWGDLHAFLFLSATRAKVHHFGHFDAGPGSLRPFRQQMTDFEQRTKGKRIFTI
jgi:hypothetical protein